MDVEKNKNKTHKHSADPQSTMEKGAEILEKAGAAASDTYDKTSEAISNAYDKTSEAVSDTYDKTSRVVSETYEIAINYGKKNPGKTILISLGVGAGVGFIIGAGAVGSRRRNGSRFAQPVINAISDIAMGFFR
ncbi:MAG: hypothetical protein HQK62_01525 [Desulfamplus sp.]|nr:hypothetical protein [Desulfamplus sp.]